MGRLMGATFAEVARRFGPNATALNDPDPALDAQLIAAEHYAPRDDSKDKAPARLDPPAIAACDNLLIHRPFTPPRGRPVSLDRFPPHPHRAERVEEAKAECDIYRAKARNPRRNKYDG